MHRAAAGLALVALLAGCNGLHEQRGSSYQLPRQDARTAAQEARLAPLIEQARRGSNGPGQCTVRLLGEKGDTTYVWATCRWLPSGAVGGPFVVTGDQVTGTEDGSGYEGSVRQLFPYDLAEAILYDAERLQPEEQPTG